MSMSAGGNDELFRMAENAAPKENRIMPSERTYLKSKKTVSLQEAISLMKQRREHPEDKIPGGLDDESENVLKKNARGRKDPTNAGKDNNDRKAGEVPDTPDTEQDLDVFAKALAQLQNRKQKENRRKKASGKEELPGEATPTAPTAPTALSGRISTVDLMNGILTLGSQLTGISKLIQALKNLKPDHGEQNASSDALRDALRQFKAGKHKVTFLVNNMEFTVKCLNMIRDEDAHCLVLAFEDESDSFFTPPMQSELTIKYDGLKEPGKLFYFGMCFSVKALGLKFLGFLLDNSLSEK